MIEKGNYGYWSTLVSNNIIDISIHAGFDFVIFDMEHGLHDINSIANSILLLKNSNLKSYVRIPQNGSFLIQRLHDIGVDGILFPMLHTKDDILNARKETIFEPNGKLGYNPFVKKFKYNNQNNSKISLSCIGMIEDLDLFESSLNLYLEFGLDGCYLGAYDMNIKGGFKGDLKNSYYLEKISKCCKILKNYENKLDTFGMDLANSEKKNLQSLELPSFKNTCLFVDSGSILKSWKKDIETKKTS